MNVNVTCLAVAVAGSVLSPILAADVAIDLSNAQVRSAQPVTNAVSFAAAPVAGMGMDGGWAYRYKITTPWEGFLPKEPAVVLRPSRSDWTGADRLVIEVFNDGFGGDTLVGRILGSGGKTELEMPWLKLSDNGYIRWVTKLSGKNLNLARIDGVRLSMSRPVAANVLLSGFYLLKPGEPLPPEPAKFIAERVRPSLERAERRRMKCRQDSVSRFVADCRDVGQKGDPCWIGAATSMENVRPRDDFSVRAARGFSLALAKGETEAFQVLVMPNGCALKDVSVSVDSLMLVRASRENAGTPKSARLSPANFKCSPVGYVKTVGNVPYPTAANVATNLPGGYYRALKHTDGGWWPDPILGWIERVDVSGDDLQSFWVQLKCPRDQPAGTYRGALTVAGDDWTKTFPLAVRVFDFEVPRASPLPMAVTFAPIVCPWHENDLQKKVAELIRKDPQSPVNRWKAHKAEWGDFLADHYVTMDRLYPEGNTHWDVLAKLRDEKRLGLFNLGYWNYPRDMNPQTLEAWRRDCNVRIRPAYEKARRLGILDHAYLYGCDEVMSNYFTNIKWAVDELKREFPGVPLSTTAYDVRFGVGSALGGIDWFTPTTRSFDLNLENVEPSRKAGHKVWWYVACGPHAPFANLFVEHQAIEPRLLMGAQTAKWRPDGFLYYELTVWNSRRCISGSKTFTDWDPRSWIRYNGDGSLVRCGPDGTPCTTIRFENFRDGLEDYAYVLEYERCTGRKAEIPVSVCRGIDQFTDNPSAVSAWREGLACAIERAHDNLPCLSLGTPSGAIKPINGVGQPPILGMDGTNMFSRLKEAGIPYSRLHDVGGAFGRNVFVDIPNLFRDFGADENDQKNYDFHYTDLLMTALVENGVEPYFRLGVTIENAAGRGGKAYRIFPPKDYAKWARICEHVIRHYTEGWADGYRMRISHWEIWNEPENFETIEQNQMWKAPFEEYIRLYSVASRHLKGKFPNLMIGGYASCGFYGVSSSWAQKDHPRIVFLQKSFTDFLSACRDQKLPLDFFSFHCYDLAEHAEKQIAFCRKTLDDYGFAKTEMSLNEWLPCPGGADVAQCGTAKQAADIAAMLCVLQNGPVDDAEIYDARATGGAYAPLFEPFNQKPTKAYSVFLAFNELRKLGCALSVKNVPKGAFACAATDGRDVCALLICNPTDRVMDIAFTMPGYALESVRVIDPACNYERTTLCDTLFPESVYLVQYRRVR